MCVQPQVDFVWQARGDGVWLQIGNDRAVHLVQ